METITIKKTKCECCGKVLKGRIVWLELSNTDFEYYKTIPNGHQSMGFFSFGGSCAKKILFESANNLNSNYHL